MSLAARPGRPGVTKDPARNGFHPTFFPRSDFGLKQVAELMMVYG